MQRNRGDMSHRLKNVEICKWCNDWCHRHKKCLEGNSGCLKCLDNMIIILSYRYYAFELVGNKNNENAKLFNPYDSNNLINSINALQAGCASEDMIFQTITIRFTVKILQNGGLTFLVSSNFKISNFL